MVDPTVTPRRSAMRCEMATWGLASLGFHQAPATTLVPAGGASDQVSWVERSMRRGKFLRFAVSAGTPLMASMREVASGTSSGSAVIMQGASCALSLARFRGGSNKADQMAL